MFKLKEENAELSGKCICNFHRIEGLISHLATRSATTFISATKCSRVTMPTFARRAGLPFTSKGRSETFASLDSNRPALSNRLRVQKDRHQSTLPFYAQGCKHS